MRSCGRPSPSSKDRGGGGGGPAVPHTRRFHPCSCPSPQATALCNRGNSRLFHSAPQTRSSPNKDGQEPPHTSQRVECPARPPAERWGDTDRVPWEGPAALNPPPRAPSSRKARLGRDRLQPRGHTPPTQGATRQGGPSPNGWWPTARVRGLLGTGSAGTQDRETLAQYPVGGGPLTREQAAPGV